MRQVNTVISENFLLHATGSLLLSTDSFPIVQLQNYRFLFGVYWPNLNEILPGVISFPWQEYSGKSGMIGNLGGNLQLLGKNEV